MSETASGPPPRRAPHPYQPIRALLQAGKNDEAIVKLCALVVTRPDDLLAKDLLFDAFFQKREWLPALALVEDLDRQSPNDARLQKSMVVTLSNMKRYDEAIAQAHQYIVRHGEDLTMLDVLKVAHFYTGKVDDGVRYGQRGIELRDAEASRLPRAGVLDRARQAAVGTKRHLVLVMGHGAVLRLRRHDQSGPEPDHLSGLDLPVLCRRRGAARLRRLSARQRRRRATSKTNIPASACSSVSW